MYCPRCGREAAPDAAFCSHCGARLGAVERPSDPAVIQSPHPENPVQSTGDPATEPLSEPLGEVPPAAVPPPYVPSGWQQAPPPAAVAPPVAEVRYGGFWRRFGALLIDCTLLWIAGGLLRLGMGVDVFDTDWQDMRSMMSSLISMVGGWLYCALLESSPLQGTLGQRAAGLRVTDLALRRISFLRATGRHFGQIISGLLLGIGYLMIAFTEKKQGLHDMMAGCLVLRAD